MKITEEMLLDHFRLKREDGHFVYGYVDQIDFNVGDHIYNIYLYENEVRFQSLHGYSNSFDNFINHGHVWDDFFWQDDELI